MTRLHRLGIATACAVGLAAPASADFIDTTWTVTGFTGDAIFVDPDALIGQTQYFERGFAEGAFFACDFEGLAATYTRYEGEAFFANPEFARFGLLRDVMTDASEAIFVHRISCAGDGDASRRRQLYPFVTNETRSHAWHLFEGGVFTLRAR